MAVENVTVGSTESDLSASDTASAPGFIGLGSLSVLLLPESALL